MTTIFALALSQLTGWRRLAVIVVFALIPVAIAGLVRYLTRNDGTMDTFTPLLTETLLAAIILPVTVAVFATAAFGNEIEDRTLGYLLLKPVARWKIVAAKYGAVLLVGGVVVIASAVVSALVAFEMDAGVAAGMAAGMAVGVVAYAAFFMFLGLMTGQALGVALVYIVVWEGFVSGLFPGVRFLSVRSYTLTIMGEYGGDKLAAAAGTPIALDYALGGATAVVILFLILTIARLRNMDVP